MAFADKLIDAVRARGTVLCAGIDPHLDLIPKIFRRGDMGENNPQTAEAVRDFCFEMLGRIKGKTAVIKPQSAMFERLGPNGMAILADLNREAINNGIIVILDAKRGDIGSTAQAYSHAMIGQNAPFPADALTINPFLGMDTLTPFIEKAQKTNAGLFVLNRTSNHGSADIQGLIAQDGRPVFKHLTDLLKPIIEDANDTCGFSSIGIVAGANHPEEAAQLRHALPSALFLIPGFGAQGGKASDALAGLVKGPEGLEGGIVNSSRGLNFPQEAQEARTSSDWRQAIDKAIGQAITALKY